MQLLREYSRRAIKLQKTDILDASEGHQPFSPILLGSFWPGGCNGGGQRPLNNMMDMGKPTITATLGHLPECHEGDREVERD